MVEVLPLGFGAQQKPILSNMSVWGYYPSVQIRPSQSRRAACILPSIYKRLLSHLLNTKFGFFELRLNLTTKFFGPLPSKTLRMLRAKIFENLKNFRPVRQFKWLNFFKLAVFLARNI
jgi:hypothetical protein